MWPARVVGNSEKNNAPTVATEIGIGEKNMGVTETENATEWVITD